MEQEIDVEIASAMDNALSLCINGSVLTCLNSEGFHFYNAPAPLLHEADNGPRYSGSALEEEY